MACYFCANVLDAFKLDNAEHINLGLLDRIIALDCDSCKTLRKRIQAVTIEKLENPVSDDSDNETEDEVTYNKAELTLKVSKSTHCEAIGFSVLHLGKDIGVDVDRMLELVRSSSKPEGDGRILNPKWIAPELFRTWKEKCDAEHPSCQIPPMISLAKLPPPCPRWFVDVINFCLVPVSTSSIPKYVALSYVWGKTRILKTSLSNLLSFQRQNVFLDEELAIQIPTTIKDAISVTELLGERFLWVDSLCIVQDDTETKMDYLNNMASIYAHASVTIIAAQGNNADAGLCGIQRQGSAPRKSCRDVHTIGDEKVIDRIFGYTFPRDHKPGSWYSRGWTYQEDIFSGRRIIFEGDSVRWECFHCTWFEDILTDQDGSRHFPHNLFTVPFPHMRKYQFLVAKYSTRNLTYPGDSLFALAGINAVLSRTFKGGFLCGLPELFFDHALLWSLRGNPKRREISDFMYNIPTWSWAGWFWKGQNHEWDSICQYMKVTDNNPNHSAGLEQAVDLYLTPIVEWYCSEDLSGKQRRPIANHGYMFREPSTDLDIPLPFGWSRHRMTSATWRSRYELRDVDKLLIPGGAKFYYTHVSDPLTQFWYPIPICDAADTPTILPNPRYISCRTQSIELNSSERRKDSCGWFYNVLRDDKGTFAGAMEIHEDDAGPAGSFELVNVSKGMRNSEYELGPPGWLDEERKIEGLVCEYYNVLWVEWDTERKVAYRKGVGWVLLDCWERLNPKWVELTLG